LILQSIEELEADLRNNGCRPVYLVLGPEMYLCRAAVGLLKRKALSPEAGAFDFAEFSADVSPVSEIIGAAGTFPMASERRLVLVSEVDNLTDFDQEALLDSLAGISPRSTLVLLAEDLDRRKRLYRLLRERHCVAEFPRLKGAALTRWATAFFRREGYRISPSAVAEIVDSAGSDLQTLAMELEKIVLYAGREKDIPDSAVDEITSAGRQRSIFDFLDAVSARNRAHALRILANLLETGDAVPRILGMIARHCRQLLIAKEALRQGAGPGAVGAAAQVPSFALDKFLRQARAAEVSQIERLFIRLAEIDRRMKSSAGDERIMLEKLICELV
jgi:DNA polymerase-3 subunit delta